MNTTSKMWSITIRQHFSWFTQRSVSCNHSDLSRLHFVLTLPCDKNIIYHVIYFRVSCNDVSSILEFMCMFRNLEFRWIWIPHLKCDRLQSDNINQRWTFWCYISMSIYKETYHTKKIIKSDLPKTYHWIITQDRKLVYSNAKSVKWSAAVFMRMWDWEFLM
jgi:hypothetical protein